MSQDDATHTSTSRNGEGEESSPTFGGSISSFVDLATNVANDEANVTDTLRNLDLNHTPSRVHNKRSSADCEQGSGKRQFLGTDKQIPVTVGISELSTSTSTGIPYKRTGVDPTTPIVVSDQRSESFTRTALSESPSLSVFPGEVSSAQRRPSTDLHNQNCNTRMVLPKILELLTSQELSHIEPKLTKLGYQSPNWPIDIFARVYLKKGENPVVRRYCQSEMDLIEKIEEAALNLHKKKGELSDDSPTYDSDFERKQRKLFFEKQRRAVQKEKTGGSWTVATCYSSSSNENEIQSIFPEITMKEDQQLMKVGEAYDDKRKDEKSDWLYWANTLMAAAGFCTILKANYLLLRKAGPLYSAPVLSTYKHQVRVIAPLSMVRCLGKEVYAMQGKDTIHLAARLRMGEYDCTNAYKYYQRVIDLHYCRNPDVSPSQFVTEVFQGFNAKVPRDERTRFLDTINREYPGVINAALGSGGSNAKDEICVYQYSSFQTSSNLHAIPDDEPSVQKFCNFMVLTASTPSYLALEQKGPQYYLYPTDTTYGCFKPAVGSNIKKGSTPESAKVAARAGLPWDPNQRSSENQAPSGGKSDSSTKPERYCSHCNSKTHDLEKCWALHPELRPKLGAKAKKGAKKGKKRSSSTPLTQLGQQAQVVTPQVAPISVAIPPAVSTHVISAQVLPVQNSNPQEGVSNSVVPGTKQGF